MAKEANSSNQSPDADLCRLIANRQYHSAFEILLDRYQKKVFRLAYSILGNATQAEDMAQDIFIRIWKGMPGYNAKASLSTWIYAISRNACWTQLRRRTARGTVSLSDADSAGDSVGAEQSLNSAGAQSASDAKMDVQFLLGQLDEKYRQVVVLFYMEQKSYDETAQLLGIPIGTVKTLLHRSKKELHQIATRQPKKRMRK